MTFRAKRQPVTYLPERGDLIHTNFSPSAGSEMALPHFAVVFTPKSYHERTGRAVVCPVTSKMRDYPFYFRIPAVPPHLREEGAIVVDQIRAIDLRVRGSLFAGRLDDATLRDLIDLLFALLEGE